MTKDQLLNLSLEEAWNLFQNNPKMIKDKMSFQEQMSWFQGFNFACYLLAKGNEEN